MSIEIDSSIDVLNRSLILLEDRLNHQLLLENPDEIQKYVVNAKDACRIIAKAATVYADRMSENINDMISQRLDEEFGEMSNSILSISEQMNQQNDEMNHKLDQFNKALKQIEKNSMPSNITNNHVRMARWLVENVKNEQGRLLKGACINEKNMVYFVEAMEKIFMKQTQQQNNDEH